MKDPTRHCKPGPGCETLPKGWNYTPDRSLVNMGQGTTNVNVFQFNSIKRNANNNKILQKELQSHQKNNKIKNKTIQINKVGGPEGQGQKMSRLKAQSLLDSGPDDHYVPPTTLIDNIIPPEGWPSISGWKENEPEGWQAPPTGRTGMDIRFKQQNLHAYFRSKDIINLDMEMRRLEREMRLEVQKRKEAPWKARRQETRRTQEQKEL